MKNSRLARVALLGMAMMPGLWFPDIRAFAASPDPALLKAKKALPPPLKAPKELNPWPAPSSDC